MTVSTYRVVVGPVGISGSVAICNPNEIAVGGGGNVEHGPGTLCAGTGFGFLHKSQPVGINGWAVDAYGDGINTSGDVCVQAYVICKKR